MFNECFKFHDDGSDGRRCCAAPNKAKGRVSSCPECLNDMTLKMIIDVHMMSHTTYCLVPSDKLYIHVNHYNMESLTAS